MLSEKSTEIVRATLPAVGAAIGDIADLFYTKLFAAHPELLRDLFNRATRAPASRTRPSPAPSRPSPPTSSPTRTPAPT